MTKHIFVDEAFAATLLRQRGYVVSTAEEAVEVRATILDSFSAGADEKNAALALLTPEGPIPGYGSSMDVGPPAPGEGDDLENPEIGMVC